MAQKKTTKKKTTKTAQTRRSAAAQRRTDSAIRREIWIFVLLAVTVILFLGAVGSAGAVGEVLYKFEHGLFGSLGYVFPFLFFGIIVYLMIFLKKYGPMAVIIAAVGTVAFLLLCGIFEFINGKGMRIDYTLADYYRLGTDGFNGGLFGGLLFKMLVPGLGMLGSYAIVVILELVCLVFITGKSVLNPLRKGGKKIVESTRSGVEHFKQDRDARNEVREQRIRERQEARLKAQEEEQERVKRRATGVALDGTDLMKPYVEDKTAAAPKKKDRKPGFVDDVSKETTLTVQEAIDAMPGPVIGDDPAADYTAPKKKDGSLDRLLARMEKKDAEKKAEPAAAQGGAKPAGTDKRGGEPAVQDLPWDTPYVAGRDTRTLSELEALDARPEQTPSRRKTGGKDVLDGSTWRQTEGSGILSVGRAARTAAQGPDYSEFADETDNPIGADFMTYGEPDEQMPEDLVESLDPAEALRQLSTELPGREEKPAAGKAAQESIWSTAKSDRESTAGKAFGSTDAEMLTGGAQAAARMPGKTITGGIATPGVAKPIIKRDYKAPGLNLLTAPAGKTGNNRQELRDTAQTLVDTLRNFGVNVEVTDISCGPAVTRYELHPEQGVKVSRIVALADDIKLNLAAADIRIEAPIPGKSAVGIEVPNKENNTVWLREILKTEAFTKASSKVTVGIGSDIAGDPVVADLAKMPHLLIAGQTGSGKSVCINTIIVSILYKASPEEVRFIMIDPKQVELSVYNGIPHLLTPVVTDPKKATAALNWAVAEMTDRYQRFADFAVRDIKGYNRKVEELREEKADRPEEEKADLPEKMSQIVIVVDEMADLMMVAPGEVEEAICRLAQLARAAGIHLVLATQRPSVNVITGLIKANVPSRIAFAVASGIDSRTILDMVGAEKLLGKGDMLFYPTGYPKPVRVQGAFVSDDEVEKVVEFIKNQRLTMGKGGGLEESMALAGNGGGGAMGGGERDELFEQCGRFIIDKEKASIGNLQRAFRIGFNRAARIMDQLCEAGVVGEEEGTKPRQILMTEAEFDELLNN